MESNPAHGHIMASDMAPAPKKRAPKKDKERKVEPPEEGKGQSLDTKA